jgi:hypothetical protein
MAKKITLLFIGKNREVIAEQEFVLHGDELSPNRKADLAEVIGLGIQMGMNVNVCLVPSTFDEEEGKRQRMSISEKTHEHWTTTGFENSFLKNVLNPRYLQIALKAPFNTEQELAVMFNYTKHTIHQYMKYIYELTDCHTRSELLAYLWQHMNDDERDALLG